MAQILILTGSGNNLYQAIIHSPVPAGNNLAGVPWKTAIANSGLNTTILPIGNGPGQISNTEANQIAAGDLIEAQVQWQYDPTWTTAQRNADLDLRAQQAIAQRIERLQIELALYGATRG